MKKILLFSFVLLTALVGESWAQERTISGKVTSVEDGSTLPGVNVVLKGTTNGTITDVDGNYRLSVPSEGGTLVFSFIGLTTEEVEVGSRSVVDLAMSSDVTELSEVIVSALGFEDNRDNLGVSVSKIASDDVVKSGEPGLITGMAGKAAGVQIVRSSGDPGAGAYIQIRGQSTLTGSVQPLIVIDGVPVYNSSLQTQGSTAGVTEQSRLNDINPDDIASMQILKGASAAALWGSRAANGVIVITTKKGSKKGKINVSFRSTYSMDEINRNHSLQTSYGMGRLGNYVEGANRGQSWGDKIADRSGEADVVNNAAGVPFFTGDQTGKVHYAITQKNDRTIYQDSNFDKIFRKGHFWDNSLSISGGNERSTAYFSLGRIKQEGIIRNNSDYERTSGRLNMKTKLNEVVSIGTNFTYAHTKSNRIQRGSNLAGLFLGALRTPADFDISDYSGTYTAANGAISEGRHRSYRRLLGDNENPIYNNPLWTINKQRNLSTVNRVLANAELTIKPNESLSFIVRPGIDTYSDERLTYFPRGSAGSNSSGRAIQETITEMQFNTDAMARYTKLLTDDLEFSGVLGMNYNSRRREWVWTQFTNFILDFQDDYINSGNSAAADRTPGDNTRVIRTSAGYAQLNFGFKDQLFLNMTGRYEVSSAFSGGVFFPSADVAWQFTQLDALKDNNILSFGKLRVSYGEVGVQPLPYVTTQYYGSGTASDGGWGGNLNSSLLGGGSFLISSALANPDVKAEIKKEFEVGTDLRFWNDKIGLSATYYKNTNSNALFNAPFAASTGFTSQYGNKGSLENKGIELELDAKVISTPNFNWTVRANFNRNRNKVTSLLGTRSIFLNGFTGSSSRIVEGHPVGTLWGGKWGRNEDGSLQLDANGFPKVAGQEGVLGDPNPDWRGGAGSTFSYKGVSLSFLFEFFQGAQYWNGTRGVLNHFGRSAHTDVETTVSAADAATIKLANGNTIAQRYTANPDGSFTFRGRLKDFGAGNVALDESWYTTRGGGFGPVGEQFVEDASWTRLREVTLGYTLNSEWLRNKTKLSSVDFSVTGRNLWLNTNWQGIDPEQNLTGASTGRGLEYFGNPNTKSVLFTIKINY